MLKEFLKYVVDDFASAQEIFDYEGRKYTNRPIHALTPPIEKTLEFNSLEGLVKFSRKKETGIILHIVDHSRVRLLSSEVNLHKQRAVFAEATTSIQPEPFQFGKYLSPDEFIINLRTRFVPTPELDKLIEVVGNISYSSSIEVNDDGLSQTVGLKSGVVLKSRTELPTVIDLQPYRTFVEVPQPPSPFLVRARKNHSDVPELALFATDCGAWRLEAVRNIKEFLGPRINAATTEILW